MRVVSIVILLAVASWFTLFQDSSASALWQRTADLFEDRPIRTVFIVGNSRTYFNNMPATLRALASSPESPVKLEVETATSAGATFETHMAEGRTKRLLAKGWDEVILQGESASQSTIEQSESFHDYGLKLAQLANVHDGHATLLVNWPYDPDLYDSPEYDRGAHVEFLHQVNSRLAGDAHLDRLNLAGAWETIRLANPKLKLTVDGNHPSPAGSYLYALAVYKYLTGAPVSGLRYVPAGVDAETAKLLRDDVDSYSNF